MFVNIKSIKFLFLVTFFTTFFAFSAFSQHEEHAAATEHHSATEKFKPGKMILEHIRDAHDWHICDIGGHPVSVSLPIIIYSEKGLEVFSSAKFEHGHASYNGYKLVEGVIEAEDVTHKFYDLSITKNVMAMMIGFILLIILMLSVARSYKNGLGAPKGIGAFVEPLIVFLQDEVVKPSIGKHYARYMPLLLTMFFGIFFLNLMGLIPIIPGGANVTGNIAFTLVLAVITFIVTTVTAKKDYWKHILMPDVPVLLYIIVIPIEIIGVLNKPIVLMIRLFANITAGHIIILGFFSLIFIFGEMSSGLGLGVSVFSVIFTLFMSFLELLVAFLQAYVFVFLSSLFFGQAIEEHHHAEAHH